MKLIFGLHLDDLVVPRQNGAEGGIFYCGPKSILSHLETHLGLAGHPDNIDYLRIEQYRQALLNHQSVVAGQQNIGDSLKEVFYQKSFEADPFATATELLSRRDELVLGGWDFSISERLALRLRTLAEVEIIFNNSLDSEGNKIVPPLGYADRFVLVLVELLKIGHPFIEIKINEPFDLLPPHFQKLFNTLANTAAQPIIEQISASSFSLPPKTDLQKFQYCLSNDQKIGNQSLSSDGSLLLIRAKRANEAAVFTAKLLQLNPDFRPTCLIPEKNRTLDIALVQEGLPSLGILSASLARPALQILKLAPTFLWQPIDPFKILEFVSLAIKPLPDKLATMIADQVAKAPGLQSEGWHAMVGRYFSALEENEPAKVVAEQRKQYRFWFERQRYGIDKTVPKSEVVNMYDYLREWAFLVFEDSGSKNNSLLVLSGQARRIVELLQALPETDLGYLALERIVRTIYEPSPVTFQEREVGHLPFAMHAGAFIGVVKEVLWWNFIQNEPPHFFSRWYPDERRYLNSLSIELDTPEVENARMIWQRVRPVLATQKRLVLIVPEIVDGEEALPHPLLGDLEAAFDNLEEITIDANKPNPAIQLTPAASLVLPKWERLELRQLGRPRPFLNVGELESPGREYETLTSLESLFYYPYQWFFKYKIKLHKSAILSVVKDNTLMGNLAHRVFEKLMQGDIGQFEKHTLYEWIGKETRRLLAREGAVLLMYGREPERIAFVNKLKYAAWSLVCHIRDNGWRVVGTEKELEGIFPVRDQSNSPSVPVRGIADLVLERESELAVVDLKWRGATYRSNTLRNEEDLQLVLYSHLVADEGAWAHTCYFIMETGKMVARNNLAFKGIVPLVPDGDFTEINERILARMEATWQWRMAQLAKGEIEIRTRQTVSEIEEKYGEDDQGDLMLEILEMKGEDAKWDDYQTLVNLVR